MYFVLVTLLLVVNMQGLMRLVQVWVLPLPPSQLILGMSKYLHMKWDIIWDLHIRKIVVGMAIIPLLMLVLLQKEVVLVPMAHVLQAAVQL